MKSNFLYDSTSRKRTRPSTLPDRFIRPRLTPTDDAIAYYKLLGNATIPGNSPSPYQENICDALFGMSLTDLEGHPVVPYAPFRPTHYIPTTPPPMTLKYDLTLEGSFLDDFYTTPIAWPVRDTIFTAHANSLYTYNTTTNIATQQLQSQSPVLAITAHDRDVVFAQKSGSIHFYDAHAQKSTTTLSFPAPAFFMVPYSFGGFLVPTYDITHQYPDFLYHIDPRQVEPNKLMNIDANTMRITSMANNPHRDMMLAIAACDGQVCLYDIRNFEIPLETLKVHPYSSSKAIAFNPENANQIATGGGKHDKDIIVSNIITGCQTARVYIGSQISSLHWMRGNTLFYTGGFMQHPIGSLRLKNDALMLEAQAPSDGQPTNRNLWSAKAPTHDDKFVVASADNSIRFFSVDHGLPKKTPEKKLRPTIR